MRSDEEAAAEVLDKARTFPVVTALAVIEWAAVVVPLKVCENCPVPLLIVKFCPPATVRVPFAVNPLVAVISPEMVGVAVQAVPVTVRFPPSEVR